MGSINFAHIESTISIGRCSVWQPFPFGLLPIHFSMVFFKYPYVPWMHSVQNNLFYEKLKFMVESHPIFNSIYLPILILELCLNCLLFFLRWVVKKILLVKGDHPTSARANSWSRWKTKKEDSIYPFSVHTQCIHFEDLTIHRTKMTITYVSISKPILSPKPFGFNFNPI